MINIEQSKITGDKVYSTILENGLKVFVCPKVGYTKKIGMYGTVYGSLDNDFIDIATGKRIKVEDGIAHFLEHKLFEQEGGNALDVFAKMGVSSNAYTSFDHTVYFFETTKDYNVCIEKLFEFVNNPYFTDENVEKEKGIIGQEIRMYDDDPNAVVYYNVLRAMYKEHPLKVDIAGTVESVNRITKESLYSCYNTFYNPANMFVIIIGDVDVDKTITNISIENNKYMERVTKKVERFNVIEPIEVANKEITKQLDVYMPYVCIGFKHKVQSGKENARNTVITEIIDEICFSKMSDFYEEMYNLGIINDPIQITYESGETFAHTIIFAASKQYDICKDKIINYIEKLKVDGVDKELFEIVKKKKKGEYILDAENPMSIHRDIIDSIIQNNKVFDAIDMIDSISKQDIDAFISNYLLKNDMVISKVIEK